MHENVKTPIYFMLTAQKPFAFMVSAGSCSGNVVGGWPAKVRNRRQLINRHEIFYESLSDISESSY